MRVSILVKVGRVNMRVILTHINSLSHQISLKNTLYYRTKSPVQDQFKLVL